MEGEGGNKWVILKTLNEPGSEKQLDVKVNYDPNKTYASGTLFETSPNSWIQLQYKGQIIVLEPNTRVETKVYKNGVSVKSFAGELKAILKDVKAKVGFFKVGNGYVWAHAEGTVFSVTTWPNSKQATFVTKDNSVINIVEKVDVDVAKYIGRKSLYETDVRKIESNVTYKKVYLPNKKLKLTKLKKSYKKKISIWFKGVSGQSASVKGSFININEIINFFKKKDSLKKNTEIYSYKSALANSHLNLGMINFLLLI